MLQMSSMTMKKKLGAPEEMTSAYSPPSMAKLLFTITFAFGFPPTAMDIVMR
jgi:hypothetical protein